MKAARLVVALLVLVLGASLAWQGTRLRLEGDFGPGPGFFPFLIGCGLALLSALWIVQIALQSGAASGIAFLPPRESRTTLVVVLAALVGFMLLLRPIGFNLAMLGLLLVLFFAIDRRHVPAKLAIAVVGSFGVHWLFEKALNVPLPDAGLPALQQFGF